MVKVATGRASFRRLLFGARVREQKSIQLRIREGNPVGRGERGTREIRKVDLAGSGKVEQFASGDDAVGVTDRVLSGMVSWEPDGRGELCSAGLELLVEAWHDSKVPDLGRGDVEAARKDGFEQGSRQSLWRLDAGEVRQEVGVGFLCIAYPSRTCRGEDGFRGFGAGGGMQCRGHLVDGCLETCVADDVGIEDPGEACLVGPGGVQTRGPAQQVFDHVAGLGLLDAKDGGQACARLG